MQSNHILEVMDELLPELKAESALQQRLIQMGEIVGLKKKERLSLDIDHRERYVFMVLQGAVMQRYADDNIRRAADFFFEKMIFVPDETLHAIPDFTYYFQAVEPTQILRWDRSEIRSHISSELLNKLWLRWYRKCFLPDIRLRRLLLLLPSSKFYNYLVAHKPEIIQRIPQKYIAEYMSVSAEHLSRLRKNLT